MSHYPTLIINAKALLDNRQVIENDKWDPIFPGVGESKETVPYTLSKCLDGLAIEDFTKIEFGKMEPIYVWTYSIDFRSELEAWEEYLEMLEIDYSKDH